MASHIYTYALILLYYSHIAKVIQQTQSYCRKRDGKITTIELNGENMKKKAVYGEDK